MVQPTSVKSPKVVESDITYPQSSYHDLQSIEEGDSNNLLSKAGIFGWNKVDEGSRFLIDTVPNLFVSL